MNDLKWINMKTKLCIFNRYKIIGTNNHIIINYGNFNKEIGRNSRIEGLDISIIGSGNTITITDRTVFRKSKIIIEADNSNLDFDESPDIKDLSVFVRFGSGQLLKWGKNTTITGGYIELCETGASVTIGENCMIGWHISIVPTDFHAVLDKKSLKVINLPGGIKIGDFCWLGHGVRLLKNAKIQNHTIVGAESVVTKAFLEEFTAIGGNPAKVIRDSVIWDRKSPTELQKIHKNKK